MLLRPTWLHTPRCLGLGEWSHHHGYLIIKTFFLHSSSVYSYHHLFLISSASGRLIPFLPFIEPILTWRVSLVSPIFLKRSLVFPILLFSSISLHQLFRKAFLSLFAILCNSAFRWVYPSFPSLPFTSLLFAAIFKVSLDNYFAFCIPWGWFWSLPPVQCHEPPSTALQVLVYQIESLESLCPFYCIIIRNLT